MNDGVPTYDQLFNPVLTAMHDLGGSATNSEIENKVIEELDLTDKQVNEIHRGNRTKLDYRLAWTRNYLKRYGVLENSQRGVWSLTKKGFDTDHVDVNEVKSYVRTQDRVKVDIEDQDELLESEVTSSDDWKSKLLDILLNMDPSSFEKFCQRLLRESGFVSVKVTGRSGDGGIDGEGVIKLNNIINLPILFQCKRYKGSVSSKEIRDFRGAMSGRTDMGIFITTGNFTRDAKTEASRDGVTSINLIDGDNLIDLVKDLELGVKIEKVEQVEIDENWFGDFE